MRFAPNNAFHSDAIWGMGNAEKTSHMKPTKAAQDVCIRQ